jgi:dTDP-4-dehydrorhamnose reductase
MSTTALQELVTGTVIGPADDGYEDARHVYNFMIDARPDAIVGCASAEDVQAAVSPQSAAAGIACQGSARPTTRSWSTCPV